DICLVFFFFFQAEDGIRDFHVTGVQTCALPISALRFNQLARAACSRSSLPLSEPSMTTSPASITAPPISDASTADSTSTSRPKRSEERRVGKECRSRGSPEQQKKNTCAETHAHT